ncbi:MAG: Uma2 family endonuclease [Acidobacteria bacterium]|nr:Uma2 family endonuclease [Acidobacteriota bacterium]
MAAGRRRSAGRPRPAPSTRSEDVPVAPPFIAIEVVSPDDRYSRIVEKLAEYKAWGVPRIWLVDSRRRALAVHTAAVSDVDAGRLPEYGVEITPGEIWGLT